MRRWLMVIALMCGPVQAAWLPVASDGGRATFADPATIQRKGTLAHMVSLVEHSRFQRMVEVGYFSQKFAVEYDCEGRRARRLGQTFHAGHMGDGAVVYSDDAEQEWAAVTPETTEDKLLTQACGTGK